LKILNSQEELDLIVLTRGGGSQADLRWFDTKEIAYAITSSRVPVVSAIGHHEDTCVAEEVCFLRQKTPTAAADYVVSLVLDTKTKLNQIHQFFARSLEKGLKEAWQRNRQCLTLMAMASQNRFEKEQHILSGLKQNITLCFERFFQYKKTQLVKYSTGLSHVAKISLQQQENKLSESLKDIEYSSKISLNHLNNLLTLHQNGLENQDPRPWLNKGFTRLYDIQKEAYVSSVDELKTIKTFKVYLPDGSALVESKGVIYPKEKS
jgi:exodeoxyribonuclease VII large subunit